MPDLSPQPATWIAALEARWPGARRRTVPIALAIALEILLLLLLLSLGAGRGSQQPRGEVVSTFDVSTPEAKSEPEKPAPAAEAARPSPATQQPQPVRASPLMPPPAAVLPRDTTTPAPEPSPPAPTPAPSAAPAAPRITAVIRGDMSAASGPKGSSAMPGDSKRIAGSGPNGEPLYAAQWYREPYRSELTGYLDDVNGSAWALINCRTVPDFKVDSCVLVDEWPDGGNMGRSILAAAWQFKVRPPRVGGRVMVGEWVRIRIDYELVRK